MFETKSPSPTATKAELYGSLAQQLSGLLEGEADPIANAANMSALIFDLVPDLNWAGFYFMRGPGLVLGPFQGKVACVRIPVGRGVCGTAIERKTSLVVADVNEFPGHIACDSASRSELVVPILKNGQAIGVLDLDSPHPGRFDDADRQGFERLVEIYIQASDLG
ncbi:GAF domain-containing protein [Microvirga brassicacearum]|uniref:GAF domain-containing protein n=1 Tax=Microvirga brassicacearum TaxID=2580413 RepID=A0A5N3P8F5_9HYPH|nr:GAF domain-containing protein [Microvirga brassicacearum]KAB0266012.1 GAF domain-containing protein [Microvirga brassicacearum]